MSAVTERTTATQSRPQNPISKNGAGHTGVTSRVRRKPGWIFRFSPADSILVVIACIHVAGMVATVVFFDQLSPIALAGIAVGFILLTCTNYQCVAHNFIHNPFFSKELLNHVFSIFNSIPLGNPSTLYRFHHLNHHRFNSDYRNEATGTTQDYSSLYRYSKDPKVAENIWTYSLLGTFRFDFGVYFKVAREKELAWLVYLEVIAMIGFFAALAYVNWWATLVYLVPVVLLGQAASMAENYLEHRGADPESRMTDSVSSYSPIYNALWFNNGYHQEHHYRPQVHWRDIYRLREHMLPESERRVVRGSHLGNLF